MQYENKHKIKKLTYMLNFLIRVPLGAAPTSINFFCKNTSPKVGSRIDSLKGRFSTAYPLPLRIHQKQKTVYFFCQSFDVHILLTAFRVLRHARQPK
jgi:hypothetical protein